MKLSRHTWIGGLTALRLELASRCGVPVPGAENAARVYERALAAGYGDEDWGATYKVVGK